MKQSLRFNFQPSYDLCTRGKDLRDDEEVKLVMKICEDIYMLNRTLIADGYDDAVEYLNKKLPVNHIYSMKSGSAAWTWTIPKKWIVKKAAIYFGDECICDASEHPLSLSSYSVPFSGKLSKEELLEHIVTEPDRPNAIPFNYHYYNKSWSFCLPYNLVRRLQDGVYEVYIDTEFVEGELKVAEWVVPGRSKKSILFSAHLCHPGQVNDGLIGVAVGLCLMRWLAGLKDRYYTYRLIAHPENIGSICYFHQNQNVVKDLIGAVFLEMLGNKNHLKMQRSRQGNTFVDELMELAMEETGKPYGVGSFRKVICNDEININGPGIDIPCVSITRWPYPEYHTSDDNPGILSMEKIKESIDLCKRFVHLVEHNYFPCRTFTGNLFLSKYGLYEDLNVDDTIEKIQLAFEGNKSVLDISKELSVNFDRVVDYAKNFHKKGLVTLDYGPQRPPVLR